MSVRVRVSLFFCYLPSIDLNGILVRRTFILRKSNGASCSRIKFIRRIISHRNPPIRGGIVWAMTFDRNNCRKFTALSNHDEFLSAQFHQLVTFLCFTACTFVRENKRRQQMFTWASQFNWQNFRHPKKEIHLHQRRTTSSWIIEIDVKRNIRRP